MAAKAKISGVSMAIIVPVPFGPRLLPVPTRRQEQGLTTVNVPDSQPIVPFLFATVKELCGQRFSNRGERGLDFGQHRS
jgi:hypothetical protein